MKQQLKEQLSLQCFPITMLIIALVPFISIPILGSQFYFRHDDSSLLLWAKEFVQPLYQVFSTDPELNGFANYPGMGGYWRPFSYLYIKLLWHIFGTTPGPYHFVAGLLFMVAVYFLFKLVKYRSGIYTSSLSCIVLFVAFHSTMYNLFHIGVPVSYFFQIGMIYCFWSYLQRQRWYHLAGMLLFLGPAMGRQTTPVILTAILIAVLIEQRNPRAILSRKNIPVLGILISGFYIMTLTPLTSQGSVISVFPNYLEIYKFLSERFLFYGTILTTGITGFIMLFFIGGGVLYQVSKIVKHKFHFDKIDWIWLPVTLLLTFLLVRLQPYAIYWLTLCCLYLFIFDDELRLPVGWAGASLLSFSAARYYHNGYLLEAGFPFAVALGILIIRLLKPAALVLEQRTNIFFKRITALAGGMVLLLIPLIIIVGDRVSLLSERVDIIRISIESNRNFGYLMNYLQHGIQQDAIIYELDEEEIGTTRYDRRFLSLKERAARVKIMSIEDKLGMLKVLNRGDIKIYPASTINDSSLLNEAYFIALNNFERKIVENRFKLIVIQEFRGSEDSAAIYRFERDPEVRL